MHYFKKRSAFILIPLLLIVMGGCGGGSGGSGSSLGSSALDVYVTDGFSDTYKQVLVTIYKIELTTDGTNYQTVFTEATGRTVDLSSLSATAELLASASVPAGTYTKARITFGDHVTLVSQSGTSTSVAVDKSLGTASSGQVAIMVPAPTHAQTGQSSALLVDFKLAEFRLVGGALQPQIGCGGDGQIGDKQRTGHLHGTISALTATGFTLQGPENTAITVKLSSATTLGTGQSGGALILANGQDVVVEGAFDAATRTVTATSVALSEGRGPEHHQRASGTVASVDTASGKFVLTVERADGFSPTAGTITVLTNTGTRIDKGMHQSGALSDITVGSEAHIDGTFDTSAQTLTAQFVGLH